MMELLFYIYAGSIIAAVVLLFTTDPADTLPIVLIPVVNTIFVVVMLAGLIFEAAKVIKRRVRK